MGLKCDFFFWVWAWEKPTEFTALMSVVKIIHSSSSVSQSFSLFVTLSFCRVLIKQCQMICMAHNQPSTEKDCLENGALDTTPRARGGLHQR